MSDKYDFKKEYRQLYQMKTDPVVIQVPPRKYLCVDGFGDPNTSREYQDAVALLYGITYTIKMSKTEAPAQGYFDYVAPPLEGFWDIDGKGFDGHRITDKERFAWTSFMAVPDYVPPQVLKWAAEKLRTKKPGLNPSAVRLEIFEEGLCVQCMHVGTYDSEPETIRRMNEFLEQEGYETDIIPQRRHHEIYLGDPRKQAPEKRKTIIRHPIKRKAVPVE